MHNRTLFSLAHYSLKSLRDTTIRCCSALLIIALSSTQVALAQTNDDFSRPDNPDVGNGWIEKNPQSFELVAGAVEKRSVGSGYRDNVVYRPASEDLADVETSIEFNLTAASPGYPQIFARLQSASVASSNTLTGYILYVNNNSTQAVLGRQVGSSFVSSLATININPGLNTSDTHRLRLRVTGSNPVSLAAYVERWDGTSWVILGQGTVDDASGARITAPGTVGFGGYIESSYRYDNFSVTDLSSGANPQPVLTTINPNNAVEGGSAFSMTVSGSDFVADSVVRWNGADRATTYVSANELQADITAADIGTAGSASVTVFSPAPGGGTSAVQTFTIDPVVVNNPVPVLNAINPTNTDEGSSAFSLTVTGNSFIAGSVVRWNGADRATTYVSANELQAAITAADVSTAGSASVTVFSPAPGGGTSAVQTFTIDPVVVDNPVPVLTAINPSNTNEGGPAFSLTVTGSDFIAGSVVRWNGGDRATTYVSANELQADITAADIANAGSASVTVFSPAPGGGTSAVQIFTIDPVVVNNPVPVLNAINPTNADEGSSAFSLTVTGNNFIAGSIVRWDGADRATTFVSANELQAAITATDVATAGSASVTVFSPAPGGGTSAVQTFTIDPVVVDNPVPVLTAINPSNTNEGGPAFSLTVTGSDFIAGSIVRWNGGDRATTYVSANELQADITAADIANAGSASVTVFSPAPGGGTSAVQTFTIDPVGGGNNPVPGITGLSPVNTTAGSGDFTLTVLGDNFIPGTEVLLDGTALATTFMSSQMLQAQVSASQIANAGRLTITTVTGAPGGGISNPAPFFVLDAIGSFFFDDFNSGNATDIGNGWTEKTPWVFSIEDDSVVGIQTSAIVYRDSIVYRPVEEDLRDVRVSVEFVRRADFGMAQVHARTRRSTIEQQDVLESYILYVNDFLGPSALTLAVGPNLVATDECNLSMSQFSTDLIDGERYRLTLDVTGDIPVQLTGEIEWFTNGEWQQYAITTATHDLDTQPVPNLYCGPGFMPPPIQEAGAVGFSKWSTLSDIYDNFSWVALTSAAATPVINDLDPDSVEQLGPGFSLAVSGSGFTSGSVVRWDGSDRPTTYVSGSMLQANIPASDILNIGTVPITVFTPAPGGGLSNARDITIVVPGSQPNPVPVIGSLNPSSAIAGSGTLQLTVDGADFVDGSEVLWNGNARPTSFVSDSQLLATISAADLTSAGTADVSVRTPAPGGGDSSTLSFAIVAGGEFFDDFSRPDNATLGNGWQEKNPNVFSIASGALTKLGVGTGYRDNVAFRPVSEQSLDMEVSAEMEFTQAASGYPQLFARIQDSSALLPNTLDAYIMYLNNSPNQLILGRQTGSSFVTSLTVFNLTENLVPGETYRMQLSTVGSNPVVVTGTVERQTPSGFVTIGQGTASDTSPNRILSPGTSGLGGYVETGYTYDNFRSRSLD